MIRYIYVNHLKRIPTLVRISTGRDDYCLYIHVLEYLLFLTLLIFSELKTQFPIVSATTFCHKTIHKRYCCNQLALIFILLHMRIIEISINANLFPVKYLENRVFTPFSVLRYVPPTGPSFPLTYVVSIYLISKQS